MRRFVATFLIVMLVLSLVGPYYAEAEGNTTDSSQIETGNEDTLTKESINPDSTINQSEIENASESESNESDLIESIDKEETMIEDITIDQPDSSTIGETSESAEEDKNKVNQTNVDREQTPLESQKETVEKNVNTQDATTLNTEIKQQIQESSISRLGQIKSTTAKIFKDLNNTSSFFTAGSSYTDSVYYIKKQAVIGDRTYYLISTKPSSVNGVIGWVNASDLKSYTHVGVDKNTKTLYIKGTGKAYSKAWGGSKDIVYSSLSSYKNSEFAVNLTEKVGNNTWYRGILGGKTVWIHSSYLAEIVESNTSRLGQMLDSKVKIYKTIGDSSSAFAAGTKYINSVYFIKKQAKIGDQVFYLISTKPSRENGVIGWVNASDLKSYTHVGVDKNAKTLYIKGTGKAYSKAWGGSKDIVYSSLSDYKNNKFAVNLTEKVGNNIWYRGTLGGKTVWIHESYVHEGSVVLKSYTDYSISLSSMLDIQMKVSPVSPQTDKSYKLWIREDAFKSGSIANGKGTIQGDKWNLRRGPGTNYMADGQVNGGTVLTIYDNAKGTDGYTWYHVKNTSGWVNANPEDVKYYLNPTNFTGTLKDSMQFVKLSESANLNINEVNQKILAGKGILAEKAKAFIDGGKANGVNEIYLIAHALLETGNGTSQLATGVEVGRDSKGNLVVANDSNRKNLTAIKKTYNMYGINAIDSNPLVGGATYAYEMEWFTPEAAIKGGAAFIGNGYVNRGQDTLYKMRWNPLYAATYGTASHQYATDIAWAYKQTSRMYQLYQLLDEYHIVLDIPRYK
ncbi:N-acetylglucosaminidase [Bacillus sp. D386]|uniref:N-acetylglucosaminidase n=1 Tax=Bacillus sp. D386 TaxID=2587155 RepID=UPI001122EA84|nr:GW dipeptide domain-containing protein [Bacillus sp. D386]